ncbi:hypothetical protein SDC9_72467 [bioreactor metagenome]|uniref:Uncharacterized protein n=1 Tax=bioreactor metagenome TaxID=1076179 RepID=A0A644YBN6_9ZZZZ
MGTTAQQIFELAIHLMDEQNRRTGAADTAEAAPYKRRALAILNVLQAECRQYSDPDSTDRERVLPVIRDFDAPLALDDVICRGALPYGLAAHLLLEESPAAASFFQQRYEERRRAMVPRCFAPIEDGYGGIGFSRSARW